MKRNHVIFGLGIVVLAAVAGIAAASRGATVPVSSVKGTTWYHDHGCSVRLEFVNSSVAELISGSSTDDTALVTFKRVDQNLPSPVANGVPGSIVPTLVRFLGETPSGTPNGLAISAYMIVGGTSIPFQQLDADTWTCLLPPGWIFQPQAMKQLGWKIFEGGAEVVSHLYRNIRVG